MPRRATEIVQEIKALLIDSGPLIDAYTSDVCPSCTHVCCRQKHGLPTDIDLLYLSHLDSEPLRHNLSREEDALCEFLGPNGCIKPRWQRAWKCTWFFCKPVLAAIESGSPRKARNLSRMLETLGSLYRELEETEGRKPHE